MADTPEAATPAPEGGGAPEAAAAAPKGKRRGRSRRYKALEPKEPDPPTLRATIADILPDWNPDNYDQLLQAKAARVRDMFSAFIPKGVDLEVHASASTHYRMRAEFSVWHEGDDCFYVMYRREDGLKRPRRLRVSHFPVASELANELMEALMGNIKDKQILRRNLFQANFHTTLSGEACLTLIYHKQLDEAWQQSAQQLKADLIKACPSCEGLTLIGRSKKQKIMMDHDYVWEKLQVGDVTYAQKQVEGGFTQPNAGICQQMLGWAQDVTRGSPDDLLELYCGNCNFTIPLAPNFRRVVATELAKSSVNAAHDNIAANGVPNIFVARMSSEDFVEAWKTGAKRTRLAELDMDELTFSTLLVDPPRAGLDPETVSLMATFDRVVYVSCNPETLKANLTAVNDSHEIVRFAMFDQFPYTDHIECGVYLKKRVEPTVDGVVAA